MPVGVQETFVLPTTGIGALLVPASHQKRREKRRSQSRTSNNGLWSMLKHRLGPGLVQEKAGGEMGVLS